MASEYCHEYIISQAHYSGLVISDPRSLLPSIVQNMFNLLLRKYTIDGPCLVHSVCGNRWHIILIWFHVNLWESCPTQHPNQKHYSYKYNDIAEAMHVTVCFMDGDFFLLNCGGSTGVPADVFIWSLTTSTSENK